ncbi:hypothetical protein OCS_05758 [Ophiocordyceps sinensis CO18]|nr:hypothetical protein OCS_05758 [Ophiocordyceps sinensis CO18]
MDEAMTAAYAADDANKATPQTPPPSRVPESPDQRRVYMAQRPSQDPSIYPPERAPVGQSRARSMPATDEPEEAWRTRNPDQTRPLNWL